MGVYLAIGSAYIEVFKEHRVGIGSGICIAFVLAGVKGVLMALPTGEPRPPEKPHQP